MFYDYRWQGAPADVDAALASIVAVSVLGPRVLDGVAYVALRCETPQIRPAALADSGPELSVALLGAWAE